MIIVDTNVISETLRPSPEPAVLAWLEANSNQLAVTAVTASELLYGVTRMPAGARKTALSEAVQQMVAAVQLLPFDGAAAAAYAVIRADQEAAGLVAGELDRQIAAIAHAGGHQLATRNVRHFAHAGVELINPWLHR